MISINHTHALRPCLTSRAPQIVYEDEKVIAFLDKFPMVPGHTLVVPKEQVVKVHEMSPETSAAVGVALSKVAAKVVEATGKDNYNVLVNNGKESGQEVRVVRLWCVFVKEP